MASLSRFIGAQERIYARVLDELRAGLKQSHWMWFIFPQIDGLGRSSTAQYYALADLSEARAYISHATLGPRLTECTEMIMRWAGKRDAVTILGPIDAIKFASSMTLFEAAGGHFLFTAALKGFFQGNRDTQTLDLLKT